MGATFPLMIRGFVQTIDDIGAKSAHFYKINTFGALFGVGLSGFLLLPFLGLNNTLIIAVSFNLFVGVLAIFLQHNNSVVVLDNDIPISINESTTKKTLKNYALLATAIAGFSGLGMEVVWTKILVQSFSATVYSFSSMLIAFLAGITLGSKIYESLISNKQINQLKLLANLLLFSGFILLALSGLAVFVGNIYGNFIWLMTGFSESLFGVSSIGGIFLVSLFFILPCAILLGILFPTSIKAYSSSINRVGQDVSIVYFTNTIFGVFGALFTSFVLIPYFGSSVTLILFSVLFVVGGAVIQLYALPTNPYKLLIVSLLFVLMIVIVINTPSKIRLNYNVQKDSQPEILYSSEGAMGKIHVVRNKSNVTMLSINGNVEADNSLTQLRHFIMKAHLPLLFKPDAKEVLVVGLGMGITASSLLLHENVNQIDIVELSKDIVKAQEYLKDINNYLLEDERVKLIIDDGRNFLKYTKNKYDVITADPIHPRISGVGTLYTKEYYNLIRDKLNDDGVILQWMPIYSISSNSYKVAIKTMLEVFPNTSIWHVPGHTLLLGFKSNTTEHIIDSGRVSYLFKHERIRNDLNRIGIDNAEQIVNMKLLNPKAVHKLVEMVDIVNDENNSFLEFRTPFDYLQKPEYILNTVFDIEK
jgi:spermidine synthase